jgi:hypothetical protein
MYLVIMADPPVAPVARKPPGHSVPPVPPFLPTPVVPSAPAATSSSAMAPPAPPPPPTAPGLLTRAAKRKAHAQMAEASSFSPFAPPAESSTAAGNRKRGPVTDSPSDDTVSSSDGDIPATASEMPPGVPVPHVNVQMASPPRNEGGTLPVVTGDVSLYCTCDYL